MSHPPIDVTGAAAALDNNYVLLLTTNSTERAAVEAVLEDRVGAIVHRDTRGAGIGRVAGRFCIHLTGAAGAQDNNSIGSLVRWMTQAPRPRPILVMIVGFAWGNPGRVGLGDVVICSEVRDMNHLRVVKGVQIRIPMTRQSSIGEVEGCASIARRRLPDLRLITGPLASAELYLADDAARDAIIAQVPDVLGGEMEAFDALRDLEVPWLLIKAISDDAGSGVGRDDQAESATAAASSLGPVLKALTEQAQIVGPRADGATARLVRALTGNSLRISRPAGARDAVMEAMNACIPHLMERLSPYGSDQDREGLLGETLAIVIAETVQNAFLHGNATHADCIFNEASVILSDDGNPYDPNTLAGDRGGAQAWRALDRLFLSTGLVAMKRKNPRSGGNSYRFTLRMVDHEIREARLRCSLGRPSMPPGIRGFAFDPECETLFYEAGGVFSYSKQFSVDRDLLDLLEAGKSLIIACRDQRQVQVFQQALSAFLGPKLRIFVGSQL